MSYRITGFTIRGTGNIRPPLSIAELMQAQSETDVVILDFCIDGFDIKKRWIFSSLCRRGSENSVSSVSTIQKQHWFVDWCLCLGKDTWRGRSCAQTIRCHLLSRERRDGLWRGGAGILTIENCWIWKPFYPKWWAFYLACGAVSRLHGERVYAPKTTLFLSMLKIGLQRHHILHSS